MLPCVFYQHMAILLLSMNFVPVQSYDGVPIWQWEDWREECHCVADRKTIAVIANSVTGCVVKLINVLPPPVES